MERKFMRRFEAALGGRQAVSHGFLPYPVTTASTSMINMHRE